ncbi:hypothetical protein CHARACLAT_030947 [Characodon lateralis]|uniref:Uncharacterized protein n=1 Tax=Characodon lateralis TaxID=208331 RepID=A0ABU7F9V6_9TELE|nr:hypothetical protein [Characodon lateralis]
MERVWHNCKPTKTWQSTKTHRIYKESNNQSAIKRLMVNEQMKTSTAQYFWIPARHQDHPDFWYNFA